MRKIIVVCFFTFMALYSDAQNSKIIISGSENVGNFISVGDSSDVMIMNGADSSSEYTESNSNEPNEQASYTVETVPNRKTIDNSYVSDPNSFLREETITQINALLSSLETKTTDQVAVVILNSIGEEVPKVFANQLFNKWGIGIRGKDNGLLILMVMDQRRVEFETGYGMESMLPDAYCKRIQETYMVPEFKKGNYDQGILEGVKATVDILSNPENSKTALELRATIAKEKRDERMTVIILFMSFYSLFALIFYINKRRKKSFKENYTNPKGDKLSAISQKRWLMLYVLLPIIYSFYMYNFYEGDYYFIVAYLLGSYFIAMLFFIEKRMRLNKAIAQASPEGEYYTNYTKYKKSHEYWWTAALFFPLVFIFYMIYVGFKKRALRNHPRNCQSCSREMHKLDEKEDDAYLKETQLLEENIKSIDYDVWLCKNCGVKEVYSFPKLFSKYSACSKCGVKASYLYKDRTLVSATYSSSGTGCKTYQCKYCHYEKEVTYTIPMKESSSSSSGSGGSSGGSWGGGSSGGGGSGSSW